MSVFYNKLGRLEVLFKLLSSYKESIQEYNKKLAELNPVIFNILSVIYKTISFVLFVLYKMFMFLMSFRIGRAFLLGFFIVLYHQNNFLAVFIGDCMIKLALFVDSKVGASDYAIVCMESLKIYILTTIPKIIASEVFKGYVQSIITSVYTPEIFKNLIMQLGPELSAEMLNT